MAHLSSLRLNSCRPKGSQGHQDTQGGQEMSNWSDRIQIIGVGISEEDTQKIKETIIEKMENNK
jgi:hypothetical protein